MDLKKNSAKFCKIMKIGNCAKNCRFKFGAVRRNANLADLENTCKMRLVAVHTAENKPLKVWQPTPDPPLGSNKQRCKRLNPGFCRLRGKLAPLARKEEERAEARDACGAS